MMILTTSHSKGKSFGYVKLLPLQGEVVKIIISPGCYPGLGASALSGRVAIYLFFQGELRLCLNHILWQYEVQNHGEQEDYCHTVICENGAHNLWEDIEHTCC